MPQQFHVASHELGDILIHSISITHKNGMRITIASQHIDSVAMLIVATVTTNLTSLRVSHTNTALHYLTLHDTTLHNA